MIKLLKRKAKRAFTLIELVVVIAVIAILAGVSVAAYFGVTESAKDSAALQEGEQLKTLVTVVANTEKDGKLTVGDAKYTLTYNADGLTVEGTNVNSDTTLDTVFNAIYYIGTNGKVETGDKKLTAGGVTMSYWTADGASATKVVVEGFKYESNGGEAIIGLAASFKADEAGNPDLPVQTN